jgi:hypothetical protein
VIPRNLPEAAVRLLSLKLRRAALKSAFFGFYACTPAPFPLKAVYHRVRTIVGLYGTYRYSYRTIPPYTALTWEGHKGHQASKGKISIEYAITRA